MEFTFPIEANNSGDESFPCEVPYVAIGSILAVVDGNGDEALSNSTAEDCK